MSDSHDTHDTHEGHEAHGPHISDNRMLIQVLVTLLVFTIATVAVTHFSLGAFAVSMALIIASAKAYIVLAYFMHLKFDSPVFRIMVGVVLFVFSAFMILTFFDYVNR
jgi:cytochrome c oxidase subunit 4